MSAYPDLGDLKMMLDLELEENLEAIAGGNNYRQVIYNLVTKLSSQGRIRELIEGAIGDNPGNEKLQKLKSRLAQSQAEIKLAEEELTEIIETHYQQITKEINWAYQQTLPLNYISYSGKQADSITEIINQIDKIPPQPQSKCLLLVKFVIYLYLKLREDTQTLEIQNLSQQLLVWLESISNDAVLIDAIASKLNEKIDNSNPGLLVKISEENGEYYLDAWLVTDMGKYEQHRVSGCYHLTEEIEEAEKGKVKLNRNLTTLPKILNSLRKASYFYWPCLIDAIHLFLPLSLIDYPFDGCSLDENPICPSCLGQDYELAVRFSKRLEDTKSRPVMLWKNKGKKIPEKLPDTVSQILLPSDYKDPRSLGRTLKPREVIGVFIKNALPLAKEQKALCELFFECGIPIALWFRKNLPGSDTIFSQGCCLREMQQQIRKKREEALDEEHIGNHLSLLWDEPRLIPPQVQLRMP